MTEPQGTTGDVPASAAPGASVVFEHVTKRYEAGEQGPGAVNDLSMTIPAGSICVFVGPSGCGKTTSLKMVNRLIEPTSGRILIDGRDIRDEDPIAAAPTHRLRHPAGRPLPTQDHRRERGGRAAASWAGTRGAGGRAPTSCWRSWASIPRAIATDIPVSCRAVSDSGSASRGRSPSTHR